MAHVLIIASYSESLLSFRGDLLGTLVAAGHRVSVAAPQASAATMQELARMKVRFIALSLDRTGLNPVVDLMSLLSIYRILRRARPDVVLAYTAKPVIYGSLAAAMAGVKRIFSMITGLGYAFDVAQNKGRYTRWMIRHLYSLALRSNRRVMFQNPDDLRDFVRTGCLPSATDTVIINGSGVDLSYFAYTPPSRSAPVFLLIARLLASKGVREYVEAARLLRPSCPQARFLLVGWPDDHPASITCDELQAWQTAGLVEYRGSTDDVRPYLQECSVYVLPSYREGTPRTVLEAMSTGRPVVTTDVPGCRETVVEGVNGFLVPPRNAAALADAMSRFIADPALIEHMGREGRSLAERKYEVKAVTLSIMRAMELTC